MQPWKSCARSSIADSRINKWGVEFDKKENGEFDLHKEGGHSEFRILHHKDNTGAEIQTSLIKTVKAHPNITVLPIIMQ